MLSRSRFVSLNLFFSNNSTSLVIVKTLANIYNLYLSSQLLELILILLNVKKNIPKITSILMFAGRKSFQRSGTFCLCYLSEIRWWLSRKSLAYCYQFFEHSHWPCKCKSLESLQTLTALYWLHHLNQWAFQDNT